MMEASAANFREILERDGRLVYTCRGVSMLPLLRQKRDVVILEKKTVARCKRLDTVLFVRANGQYVLHRILKVLDGGYWIVGDNCVGGENVREEQVIGVLTAVKRGSRTIRMTDWDYKLYSHLWCDAYPVRFFLLRVKSFVFRGLRYVKRKVVG